MACVACRRQELHESDIVNRLRLSSYCKEQLQHSANRNEDTLGQAMQRIDSTIAHHLQQMVGS